MFIPIAGSVNNIRYGEIFIVVDKFFAFWMRKNWPWMVGANIISSNGLHD